MKKTVPDSSPLNTVIRQIPSNGHSSEPLPVSVIILAFNEERNLEECLQSLKGFSDDLILVDSGSTDATLDIATRFDCRIYHHPFENYSRQRNWALGYTEPKYGWIMNIDADHRLTSEIKDELRNEFSNGIGEDINGFMASRRTMFMGRWIKHGGHYPVYHGVLFRKGFGECEDKEYDQHFLIHGQSKLLKGDLIDIITDSLTSFTQRHNRWATLEAQDALRLAQHDGKVKPNKRGNAMERRRYQRMKYYSYPLFWRVFLYSFYRYVLKGGFRDGKEGLIFHCLQGFWFRMLVDAKMFEARHKAKAP